MRNLTVTRVGVSSIGRLLGTVNLIIGVAIGVLASIVAIVNYLDTTNVGLFEGIFATLGILALGIVVYPLVAFAFGWLYGVLVAFIFNVVIGVSGGVSMQVEDEPVLLKK